MHSGAYESTIMTNNNPPESNNVVYLDTVHARKMLVHERQLARPPSFARLIALTSLELHVRSRSCLSVLQSFLLHCRSMPRVSFRVKQD